MNRTDRQVVDAALVAVCSGKEPKLTDNPAIIDDFVVGARFHRIAPLAHVALRKSQPGVAELIRGDRDKALLNHLRMTALLSGVAKVLDDIDWVVFKGPVLSEFAHPVPGLRFYKDLDLLVAPKDFKVAYHRLFDAGWRVVVGNESLLSDEFPGEIPLINAGVVLDLHWAMQVMKSVRGRFSLTAEGLLERRTFVALGPARVSVLASEDALIHVCQHAALGGATRLGHLLDADQLARQVTHWQPLIERARAWGAEVQVGLVLGRARRLFGTPVPADLEGQLGLTSAMATLLRVVDTRWPAAQLRRDESWVRLVTRASRRSVPLTSAVALQRAAHGVVQRLHPRRPQHPRSAPDPQVIEQYLTSVANARLA